MQKNMPINVGKLNWSFSGGRIPMQCTGREPAFTSHDKISVLNTSDKTAKLELTIFFEDQLPVGKFKIEVPSMRLRKIRFNDIIDPQAIFLETNYGCFLQSNVPLVVQFSRMDTGINNNAQFTTMAFPVEDST